MKHFLSLYRFFFIGYLCCNFSTSATFSPEELIMGGALSFAGGVLATLGVQKFRDSQRPVISLEALHKELNDMNATIKNPQHFGMLPVQTPAMFSEKSAHLLSTSTDLELIIKYRGAWETLRSYIDRSNKHLEENIRKSIQKLPKTTPSQDLAHLEQAVRTTSTQLTAYLRALDQQTPLLHQALATCRDIAQLTQTHTKTINAYLPLLNSLAHTNELEKMIRSAYNTSSDHLRSGLNFLLCYEDIEQHERTLSDIISKVTSYQDRIGDKVNLIRQATATLAQLGELKKYIGSHNEYAANRAVLQQRSADKAHERAMQQERDTQQAHLNNERQRLENERRNITVMADAAAAQHEKNAIEDKKRRDHNRIEHNKAIEYRNHVSCRTTEKQLRDQLESVTRQKKGQKDHIATLEGVLGKRRETLQHNESTIQSQSNQINSLQKELAAIKSDLNLAISARDNNARDKQNLQQQLSVTLQKLHILQEEYSKLRSAPSQQESPNAQLAATCRQFAEQVNALKAFIRTTSKTLAEVNKNFKDTEGFPKQQMEQLITEARKLTA